MTVCFQAFQGTVHRLLQPVAQPSRTPAPSFAVWQLWVTWFHTHASPIQKLLSVDIAFSVCMNEQDLCRLGRCIEAARSADHLRSLPP